MTLETKLDIPKEFKAQDIEANCFFTPRTWRVCFYYYCITICCYVEFSAPCNHTDVAVIQGDSSIIFSSYFLLYILVHAQCWRVFFSLHDASFIAI